MVYYTGIYRGETANWSVGVQKLVRRDGVPVVFACLGQEEADIREQTVACLTDWFYDTALGLCQKGREIHCTERVYQAFHKMRGQRKEKRQGAAAVFFAMGEECFYAWRGRAGIACFQIFFDRVKGSLLTGEGMTESGDEAVRWRSQRAVWEKRAGILLGSCEFLDAVRQRDRELAECLRATSLQTAEQTARHLRELGMCVEQQGAQETAAIFCMAV